MARFVRMMANRVCLGCGVIYGTVAGSVDSHGYCSRPDCQDRKRKDWQ